MPRKFYKNKKFKNYKRKENRRGKRNKKGKLRIKGKGVRYENLICDKMYKTGKCDDEKCNHLKIVQLLKRLHNSRNLNYRGSVSPYREVRNGSFFGAGEKGTLDFLIDEAKKDDSGKIIFSSLNVELKTKKGRLTKEQKITIKNMRKNGNTCVAVCHGYDAFEKLLKTYLNKKTTKEDVEKLCFAGNITLESILGKRKRKFEDDDNDQDYSPPKTKKRKIEKNKPLIIDISD